MKQTDVAAVLGAAALTIGVLTGFDLLTGSDIAWLFNLGATLFIAVFVGYTRTAG
jgi:hypothetical protein